MKIHVISVHGFNIYDAGKNTVAKILPYFHRENVTLEVYDYGHFGIFDPRRKNDDIAEKLSNRIKELNDQGYKVIVVGHSNGCAIIHQTKNCVIDCAVYINAAVDRWRVFPDTIRTAHVWHSPSDKILWISKFLIKHIWGAMGAFGYHGPKDFRVFNFNKQHDYAVSSRGHSDVFKDDKIKFFGPVISQEAMDAVC